MATAALPHLLKILADDIRLRVLGLVAEEELGVGELARILGLSPSRLANHLRILREADLILDRKEGTWRFVRLNREACVPADLWDAVFKQLADTEAFASDKERLTLVLEERRHRSRSYFDRMAPHWDRIGSDFTTGVARHRVATHLVSPKLVVADVGSGTGYLAAPLVGLVRKVILVDHSPAMIEGARRKLAGAEDSVDFREGELDALPLADEEVDAIIAGMVVHHVPDLAAFGREAWRALRPGGCLVIEDLLPHREAWMRDEMADLRLGIEPREIAERLSQIGFQDVHVERPDDHYRPGREDGERVDLEIFVLRARKPQQCQGVS